MMASRASLCVWVALGLALWALQDGHASASAAEFSALSEERVCDAETPAASGGLEAGDADEAGLLQLRTVDPQVPIASSKKRRKVPASPKKQVPLKQAEALTVKDPIKLVMQPTKLFAPWLSGGGFFWTRGYGTIPGPTIRVKPGETVKISFANELGPVNPDCVNGLPEGSFPNPFSVCHLNTTNVHTHGLHTSPKDPGDNALKRVEPGETAEYEFQVPEDHMGGTHWYHPHNHHSASSQAGGGAAGFLIVEDLLGAVPPEVAQMTEITLMYNLVHLPTQMRLEQWGKGNMWIYSEQPKWRFSLTDYLFYPPKVLVNGQVAPTVDLKPGVWHRVRQVYASTEMSVVISMQLDASTTTCQVQLLAKDGIYLHEAPRPLTEEFTLAPGNRADLAIACSCPSAEPCGAWMSWTAKMEPFGDGKKTFAITQQSGQLFYISVAGSAPITPLPKFSVKRPCYLADLRQATVPEANQHQLTLGMMPPLDLKWDGVSHLFHKNPLLDTLPVGDIYQVAMTGLLYHPVHLHVGPYQILDLAEPSEFYQVGDWHDTLRLPEGNKATVRFQTDRFTGHWVMHCHILEHEDTGMMGFLEVTGTEGSVWPGATALDATCFRAASGVSFQYLPAPASAPSAPAAAQASAAQAPGAQARGAKARGR